MVQIQNIKKLLFAADQAVILLDDAINNNADAFVTADIKYHTFQDAENKIFLIDAGHYETEIPVLDEIKKRIEKSINRIRTLKFISINGYQPTR
ncbi:MAG: Nif3-like dinuclear metal center hexameric protein [Ignavibacteriales bacterium]|nr:Nif3-like dinuclear metal center hexameric protein [Ignavibacteriales bacterium]